MASTDQMGNKCSLCNEVKPKAQFKRRLSLAQTRAFLRQPNATTRYITTSKLCSDCRNKAKRTRPLTIKEIRTKISSGDMNKMVGEMRIAELKRAIPLGRSKVMKEYWQKKKADPSTKLKADLQKQVMEYANRYHSTKAQIKSGKASPNQVARLPQYRYEYEEAKRIRDNLIEQKHEGAVELGLLIKPYKTQ